MERINWRSDFDLAVGADALARMPEGSALTLTLRTAGTAAFTASVSGDATVNCRREEDGRLRVLAKDHGLPCGRLRLELRADIPDADFTGGLRTVCDVWDTGVTLVPGKAGATEAEVEALLPLVCGERGEKGEKGDRGEPLRWEDLTGEQVAELRRPAEEAAAEAREVAGTYAAALAGKAERSELSNVLAEEPLTPGNFPELGQLTRERLKMDLFVDMWNAAATVGGKVYGKYDPDNAPDPEHPFLLNGLWLTYAEAVEIYSLYPICATSGSKDWAFWQKANLRTLFPVTGYSGNAFSFNAMFSGMLKLERLVLSEPFRPLNAKFIFTDCVSLVSVEGVIKLGSSPSNYLDAFKRCVSLRDVQIEVAASLSLADSPNLSLASLQYLVENAVNTAAITVTVHADVYAKLANSSNTEWHSLVGAAAEKNITFVKP